MLSRTAKHESRLHVGGVVMAIEEPHMREPIRPYLYTSASLCSYESTELHVHMPMMQLIQSAVEARFPVPAVVGTFSHVHRVGVIHCDVTVCVTSLTKVPAAEILFLARHGRQPRRELHTETVQLFISTLVTVLLKQYKAYDH